MVGTVRMKQREGLDAPGRVPKSIWLYSLLHDRDCPNEAIENDVNIEFCFVTSAFRNHFVLCV